MSREDFIAAWVVDKLMGNAGRELPAECPKARLRECVKHAIAEAEAAWPEFEAEVMRLAESDRRGRLALGLGEEGRVPA